jgi:heat shock protein HslJ
MKKISVTAGACLLAGSVLMTSCGAKADANPNSPSPPGSAAQTPSAQTPLRGTQWSLVALGGTAVTTPADQKAPSLVLTAMGSHAGGFAGCNQWSASYTATDDTLRVTGMIMTRMFCTGRMDLERDYVAALETARNYRITNTRLELLVDSKVVAAFEKR